MGSIRLRAPVSSVNGAAKTTQAISRTATLIVTSRLADMPDRVAAIEMLGAWSSMGIVAALQQDKTFTIRARAFELGRPAGCAYASACHEDSLP